MFNNRMLAVAAVLAMAVPALGAAAPIVVPAVPETLVEGHTVFTVIEIDNRNATGDQDGDGIPDQQQRFAAAVAVLVREYRATRDVFGRDSGDGSVSRFPGVLWFNDQYLVNPDQSESSGANLIDPIAENSRFRYPCGGAVMAVNAADPDPRVVIARVSNNGAAVATIGPSSTENQTYAEIGDVAGSDYGSDYAWIGADVGTGQVYSDTVAGSLAPAGYDYRESYLITDPNDHSWIIDVYDFYTRDGSAGLNTVTNIAGGTTYSYSWPVWVVNTLGSPVFVPDAGSRGETCAPFVDNPVFSYQEPSRNGFCYGGQAEAVAPAGCTDREAKPLRQYNALLYFKLEDLRVANANADHSDPTLSGDTNGCQVGTEWTCPGYDGVNANTGNDGAEGNSHPFHPTTPPHTYPAAEDSTCSTYFAGTNPVNHGGSTSGVCDYTHATRDIDVYFSPAGRPFPPLVRDFDVRDLQGSTAPFYDFHSAHPTTP